MGLTVPLRDTLALPLELGQREAEPGTLPVWVPLRDTKGLLALPPREALSSPLAVPVGVAVPLPLPLPPPLCPLPDTLRLLLAEPHTVVLTLGLGDTVPVPGAEAEAPPRWDWLAAAEALGLLLWEAQALPEGLPVRDAEPQPLRLPGAALRVGRPTLPVGDQEALPLLLGCCWLAVGEAVPALLPLPGRAAVADTVGLTVGAPTVALPAAVAVSVPLTVSVLLTV